MNQTTPLTSPARQPTAPTSNPFARALAETENASSKSAGSLNTGTNPLAEALARSGGSFGDVPGLGQDANNPYGTMPDFWNDDKSKQLEAAKQREKLMLRKQQHDRINPVDQTDIYAARETQVKKQIEEVRKELRALITEVKMFDKEVDLTLLTETAEPGISGNYFINFFHQLRQFIMLLRAKIQSAHTWMQQGQNKQKKKPKRGGLLIEGSSSEKTATVYDMMHHERSATYGGS